MTGVIMAFSHGLDGTAGVEDTTASKLSTAQRNALRWLAHRNGDGVFDRNQVLLAAGERGPFMRSTWSSLEGFGLAERYDRRRFRLTDYGRTVREDLPPGDPDVEPCDWDDEED